MIRTLAHLQEIWATLAQFWLGSAMLTSIVTSRSSSSTELTATGRLSSFFPPTPSWTTAPWAFPMESLIAQSALALFATLALNRCPSARLTTPTFVAILAFKTVSGLRVFTLAFTEITRSFKLWETGRVCPRSTTLLTLASQETVATLPHLKKMASLLLPSETDSLS